MEHDPSDLLFQYVSILPPAVGQSTLHVPPDPLVWIELRCVGGQRGDVQAAAILLPHLPNLFAAMVPALSQRRKACLRSATGAARKRPRSVHRKLVPWREKLKSYPFFLRTDGDRRDP
jgi:hypothetical protein